MCKIVAQAKVTENITDDEYLYGSLNDIIKDITKATDMIMVIVIFPSFKNSKYDSYDNRYSLLIF